MAIVTRVGGVDLWALGALPLGVALDLALGDPRGWPHPVRAVGGLIRVSERGLRIILARLGGGASGESLAGVILATVVVGVTAGLAWALTDMCDHLGGPAVLVGRGLLVYWGLAIRSLGDETLRASEAPDLAASRRELAMIVGRDTGRLDEAEVGRACLETIGENTNDAIVAPLFWLAIAGPPGLWAYKAINTLDSMVGHRDARHRYLGRASARLDDLANLVPARLTWLLISLAAGTVGEAGAAALRVGWRDGRKHQSPNAAWGEAALAGALGVRLGGRSTYDGIPSDKPLLGDPGAPIGRVTVRRAVRVMQVAALLAAGLAMVGQVLLSP